MNRKLNQIGKRLGHGNVAGIVTGLIGLVFSFGGGEMVSGRELGDPIPIILTLQGLIRGNLLYLDRLSPLLHFFFAIFLGLLAVFILMVMARNGEWTAAEGSRAARVGAILNVGVIALVEIDAVVVAMWYALAGAISVSISSFSAGHFAVFLIKYSRKQST